MKSKHTPGPFKQFGACPHSVWTDDGETQVATCRLEYGNLSKVSYDEALANAQLFAAAPDLLMACKMALVQLNGDDPKWIGVTIVTLQDAITKAEGRDE